MSRRRRHRARATVLSAASGLLALNVGLVVLLAARPDLRDPLFYGKQDRLEEQLARPVSNRITIVAIGSSRTANAFHPPTVEAAVTAATGRPCLAFNAAVLGRGPIFQPLHLQRLLDRGIRPDIVVVEIVPSLFAAPNGKPAEIGHLRPDRLTWKEIQEMGRLGYSDPEYRSEWRKSLYNPWFAFRFQLLGLFQPRWTPPQIVAEARAFPNRDGWQPYTDSVTPESYRKGLTYARGGHFENLRNMDVGEAAVEALREVLAMCRHEGITAVVVLSPEGSEFRSWYGCTAKATTKMLKSIACEGTDGRVIDARDWLPDDAFADGHHMLYTAAPTYTKRLVKELIIPALKTGE